MTTYTLKDLNREAKALRREIRKRNKGGLVKFRPWTLWAGPNAQGVYSAGLIVKATVIDVDAEGQPVAGEDEASVAF